MVCLGRTDCETYMLSMRVLSFKVLEEESGDSKSPEDPSSEH